MRTLQSVFLVGVLGAAMAAVLPACSSDSDDDTSNVGGAGPSVAGSGDAAGASNTAGSMSAAGSGTVAGSGNTAGAMGTAGGGTTGPTGDATKGATTYKTNSTSCPICHGMMGEGGIGQNITGSTTAGIGAWSQAEFLNAVRNGKARSGKDLCVTMPRTPAATLSDQDIADMYAFLLSIKTNNTPAANPSCNTM